MTESSASQKRRWADLCILLLLGTISLWYLYDAYRASKHIYNLIFVAPLSVIVFLLCAIESVRQWFGRVSPPSDLEPLSGVVPVVLLFSGYIFTLNWLGFDLGTALFVGLFLRMQGERRLPWLLGYSIVFATLTALFFSTMLPYPLPLFFLPTEY